MTSSIASQSTVPHQAVRAVLREALKRELRDLLALIAKIRTKSAQIDPGWIRAQAQQILSDELRARFAPLAIPGAETFRFAELAIIATLDEACLARFGAGVWPELGPSFHCGLSAGAEVLRYMMQHLSGRSLPREMIELYLLCLSLGFRGGGSDVELQRIRDHLGTALSERSDSLFVTCAASPPPPAPPPHSIAILVLSILPLMLLLGTTRACVKRLDADAANKLTSVQVSTAHLIEGSR